MKTGSSAYCKPRLAIRKRASPRAGGRLLVVGAGGGLKFEGMARAYPGWPFDGVDPGLPMLDLAAKRLECVGVLNDRVALHHGYSRTHLYGCSVVLVREALQNLPV